VRRKLYLERLFDFVEENVPQVAPSLEPKTRLKNTIGVYRFLADKLSDLPNDLQKTCVHDTVLTADFLVKFSRGESSIYKIAEKFGKHLGRTDLDVPADFIIRDNTFSDSHLFEFSDPILIGGVRHDCAILSLGEFSEGDTNSLKYEFLAKDEYEKRKHDETGHKKKSIALLFPDLKPDGSFTGVSTYYVLHLMEGKTISECVAELEHHADIVVSKEYRDLIAFSAKCLLYIKSGEPDLVKERGQVTTAKKEKKARAFYKTHCPFDVVNVGYGLHGTVFSKNETNVSLHCRWQRVGPELSGVKLVWVREHVRTYTKVRHGAGTSV